MRRYLSYASALVRRRRIHEMHRIEERYGDDLPDEDGDVVRVSPRGFGMSLLDIIACALGAKAILAVLLMIIKIPIPPPISQDFILYEADAKGKGIMGFLVKPPGVETEFVIRPPTHSQGSGVDQLQNGSIVYATSVTYDYAFDQDKGRSLSYLTINEPVNGAWDVRPYYYSYELGDGGLKNKVQLENIEIRWWTRDSEYPGLGLELYPEDFKIMQLDAPGFAALEVQPIVIGKH